MTIRKTNIFLQARSDSNRLPYKSLLPINNIPLVVLCAKRLMGKIFKITVVTSVEKSDDYLVEILKKNKINFFRGSLDNVYQRFLDASKKLSENDIIIRATADNPFVNYLFVKNTLEIFLKNKDIYKGVNHKKHFLPYGMSIEIFRKSLLLNHKKKLSKYSMEHVSSEFYKYDNQKIIKKNKLNKNFSNLSCSLDTFDDYKKLNDIFLKFKSPIKVSYVKLIDELSKYRISKINYFKKTKYILGGAQIGSNYSNFKQFKILKIHKKKLIKENFSSIDTAFNYSKSHQTISKLNGRKNFNIISKLNYSNIHGIKKFYKENFFINFYKILITINQNKLDTLLIHSFKDFKKNYRNILEIFKKLNSLKLIKNFGVSIYYPKELLFLIKNFSNLTIQFPINVVDYRWSNLNLNYLKRKSKSKFIARSIFLRGKLLIEKGYIKNRKKNNIYLKILSNIKNKYKINSNLGLCIKFINSLNFLDNVVIGFENLKQIEQVVKHKNAKFKFREAMQINKMFKFLNSNYIDLIKI